MGWIIWALTYYFGIAPDPGALALNPWFITLCFFIGSIQIKTP